MNYCIQMVDHFPWDTKEVNGIESNDDIVLCASTRASLAVLSGDASDFSTRRNPDLSGPSAERIFRRNIEISSIIRHFPELNGENTDHRRPDDRHW